MKDPWEHAMDRHEQEKVEKELTTLRERVKVLTIEIQLSEVAGMVKDARIRELEQAMPDAGFLRATADDVFRGVALVGAGKDLIIMADRIEKVMTKQPSKK